MRSDLVFASLRYPSLNLVSPPITGPIRTHFAVLKEFDHLALWRVAGSVHAGGSRRGHSGRNRGGNEEPSDPPSVRLRLMLSRSYGVKKPVPEGMRWVGSDPRVARLQRWTRICSWRPSGPRDRTGRASTYRWLQPPDRSKSQAAIRGPSRAQVRGPTGTEVIDDGGGAP